MVVVRWSSVASISFLNCRTTDELILPVTINRQAIFASANTGITRSWKISNARPGPECGLTKTYSRRCRFWSSCSCGPATCKWTEKKKEASVSEYTNIRESNRECTPPFVLMEKRAYFSSSKKFEFFKKFYYKSTFCSVSKF